MTPAQTDALKVNVRALLKDEREERLAYVKALMRIPRL